jgi:hypothetical protein
VSRPLPEELRVALAPYDQAVVDVALALRDRVLAVVPNAHEVVWDATNAVSVVYAPSARWQDGICHVAVYAGHVNLGFNDGASLPDPGSVLVGSGARIRHVRFGSVAEVEQAEWVDGYLRDALSAAGLAADTGDGGTTLRTTSGAKRRP